jgi:hypothetical protein
MADEPQNSLKHESLDEIVGHSAVVVAEQIQQAAAWAGSEMDLQIEVAGALKEFARRAQVTMEGHHNITIATGRPDSVYGSVIVEYKEPGVLSANRDAAGNKKVIEQLKQRFYDFRREEGRKWNTMFGVGTDGKYFIFLRFRDEKWTDQEPLPVDRYSTERFLWALYNLGQKGKPYQPEYLYGDFGSEGESGIAKLGVQTLYDEIRKTENPKAEVFFNQWKILFGEVCGYDVENLSDKLKKLAEFYGVHGKPEPAPLLFAVHSYYAILIKLLASAIVSFFNPLMPSQLGKLLNATTSAKLKRELAELEGGGIIYKMGITNFLEGDLFSWYLAIWNESIEQVVRRMVMKLDEYNPGTFSEDPEQSRDLLKKLYQHLFPKSVRHDLGEYYTPDWLADHVLNELGYEGDPDKRILDPACGSGTFLVMAINRIRRWYDRNREKLTYGEGDLLKKILTNVVGFDLNPLAVMAARTNYLVAIKDLVRDSGNVEIPVYLCDSVMTPAEYRDLFEGPGTVAEVPCSALKPPYLLVPKEIANNPKSVAKYAEILEECIRHGFSSEQFLSRCGEEDLSVSANKAHIALYEQLVVLDKQNKNGIWARMIKNNFAPLFQGRESFDYIAGNPPWVNWEDLPKEYRTRSDKIWTHYSLTGGIPLKKRQSSSKSKTDISILMTYVSCDMYLKSGGCLGFVITRSIFQSEIGGWHFRAFRLPKERYLKLIRVDDLDRLKPFRGRAANVTAAMFLQKGAKTSYPINYFRWETLQRGVGGEDDSFREVHKGTRRLKWVAYPVRKEWTQSSWIVGPEQSVDVLRTIIAPSPYANVAREGINTRGANGVYFVDVIERRDHKLMVRNRTQDGDDAGRIDTVEQYLEDDFVFPLLRGRDTQKWYGTPSSAIVLPHAAGAPLRPIEFGSLGKNTRDFLLTFEDKLRGRKKFRNFDPSGDDWYGLYSVLPATFADAKVVWKEMARGSVASVVTSQSLAHGNPRVVIPDHKLMIIPTNTELEAHFVAAFLNSSPSRYIVMSFAISTGVSTHILDKLPIPRFDLENEAHVALAELAAQCRQAARSEKTRELASLEHKIDAGVAKFWRINEAQLDVIQRTLEEVADVEEIEEARKE